MDRLTWAEEEFALMETIRWTEPERGDPVLRVKGARDMGARTVHGLRSGLEWRDGLAREGDRAPFRVIADPVLLALAASPPSTVDALVHTKGFSRSITRSASRTLLEELTRVAALPEAELAGYPAREPGGRGRPPPEIEELVLALKEVRNAGADRIELPRGTVLPNAALLEIAWARPSSLAELVEVPGVKRWQAGVVGEALIGVLPSG
jgi:ribonuclease D